MRAAAPLALVVVFAVLAGCNATPSPDSGIDGTVLLGPTCPVQRDPPDPQCADRPYAASLELTNPEGTIVVRAFHSDSNGTFHIAAAPGSYAIRSAAESSKPPTCGSTETIVVIAGHYTKANVSCDSGIR